MPRFRQTALDDSGDEEVIQALFERCYNLLFHIAMDFFHNTHYCEEAIQDTFLAAVQNFSKISSLNMQEQDSYLVIILKNKCKDILRREKKYVPEEEALVSEPSGDSVHAAVEGADIVDRVAALIGALPDKYQEILERRLLLEQNHVQIAQALGLSESTVSRRFEKGRAMLAKALQKEGISLEQ